MGSKASQTQPTASLENKVTHLITKKFLYFFLNFDVLLILSLWKAFRLKSVLKKVYMLMQLI